MTDVSQKWLNALDVLTPFSRNYTGKLYASEISRRTKIPQKTVHRKLEILVRQNLLDYAREGKNKLYFLDLNKKLSFSVLVMIETFKEIQFMNDHPEIAVLFSELPGDFILFGSYAKGLAKKSSDIDIIFLGKRDKKVDQIIERYPFEVNIFYFTLEQFRNILKKGEHLALEVVNDHIYFGDKEKLIKLLGYDRR